jgi:7,8-dihydropterin-6-yl-methyl-4-(beta-D-ribofuranosyl)aminobenzene 5'-phosphate synthase
MEKGTVLPKNGLAIKGSYILLIKLAEEQTTTIGSRQNIHFPSGYYAYVGSAMGGFKSRLSRHLQGNKKPHWHIDYLLQKASINGIIRCETKDRIECVIAQALSRQFDSVPGFGSSDCKCRSHLFFAPDERQMKSIIKTTLELLSIQPRLEPEPVAQPPPLPRSPEIIIVYDNNPFDNRLKTGWGFSCLVRLAQKTILFDTGGDSSTLLYNMSQLQIDHNEVEAVVLSHIDGDHVGGLGGFLRQNSDVTVYLPRSFPSSFKDDVKSFKVKLEEIHEARKLLPKVYTTGELDGGIKEQSMIITTDQGLVIVTGCSHPGVVNIIQRAKEILPDSKVYLVVGGWHLGGASSAQLKSIIDGFRQLGVGKVAPCHCSGNEIQRQFKQCYGDDYIDAGVGKRIPLPENKQGE